MECVREVFNLILPSILQQVTPIIIDNHFQTFEEVVIISYSMFLKKLIESIPFFAGESRHR